MVGSWSNMSLVFVGKVTWWRFSQSFATSCHRPSDHSDTTDLHELVSRATSLFYAHVMLALPPPVYPCPSSNCFQRQRTNDISHLHQEHCHSFVVSYGIVSSITVCAVAQHFCKGDERFQWENSIFRVSQLRNSSTDFQKILHIFWLCRWPHPTHKHLDQSAQRGRVCTCGKLSSSGVFF